MQSNSIGFDCEFSEAFKSIVKNMTTKSDNLKSGIALWQRLGAIMANIIKVS